jgi:hypothetical protein
MAYEREHFFLSKLHFTLTHSLFPTEHHLQLSRTNNPELLFILSGMLQFDKPYVMKKKTGNFSASYSII